MTEQLLSSPFFYSLGLSLIHFLWQGLLVALLLKSALVIIPARNPQLRYAFSAFAMLLPLLAMTWVMAGKLTPVPAPTTATAAQ